MPILGRELYADLWPLLPAAPADAAGPDAWFDAHTHIGHNDPDGFTATVEDIIGGLDDAGHRRALLFAMHEPDGYRAANDTVAATCAGSDGRLQWLARVDPNARDAREELRRCLAAGAVGLKLHPRSDGFGLPHPVVDELVAECARTRRPVLFHAGRGIPNLGLAAAQLARDHRAPIILAHAGISDLGLLEAHAAELPDLYFDTAWWNVSDLLQLLRTVPPARILYASDMPYGTGQVAALQLARCATEAGLPTEALASICGAQLERLIAGEPPVELGPAPGPAVLAERVLRAERVSSYAGTALVIAFQGGDSSEAIALARLGCQHGADDPYAELLDCCDALLARAEIHQAQADGDPHATIPGAFLAHSLAGTPHAGASRRIRHPARGGPRQAPVS